MRGKQHSLRKKLVLLVPFLFSLMGSGSWASMPEGSLLLENDELTGHLSQVTLRTVLEQLQKQMGIVYEAPTEELDKLISVELHKTPILPALAKILAPWDYAFTMNAAGRLQFLYITPKAPASEIFPDPIESRDQVVESAPEIEIRNYQEESPVREAEDGDSSLAQDRQNDGSLSGSSSAFASPSQSYNGMRTPGASTPMAIQPVPDGTTMPIAPSTGGSGMQVNPAINPPNMPIIPASSYPPMEIQPVPDYLQEEMLRSIQP